MAKITVIGTTNLTQTRLSFPVGNRNAVANRAPKLRAAAAATPSDSHSSDADDADRTLTQEDEEDAKGGKRDDDSDSDVSSVNDIGEFETDDVDQQWEEEIERKARLREEAEADAAMLVAELDKVAGEYLAMLQAKLDALRREKDAFLAMCGARRHEPQEPSAVSPVPEPPTPGTDASTSTSTTLAPAPTPTSASKPAQISQPTDPTVLNVDAIKWLEYHARLEEKYGKLTTVEGTENRIHQILRYFDNMEEYGPCIGAIRRERWDRARDNGLKPPEEIDEILNTVEGKTGSKYVNPVFVAKITDYSEE